MSEKKKEQEYGAKIDLPAAEADAKTQLLAVNELALCAADAIAQFYRERKDPDQGITDIEFGAEPQEDGTVSVTVRCAFGEGEFDG